MGRKYKNVEIIDEELGTLRLTKKKKYKDIIFKFGEVKFNDQNVTGGMKGVDFTYYVIENPKGVQVGARFEKIIASVLNEMLFQTIKDGTITENMVNDLDREVKDE